MDGVLDSRQDFSATPILSSIPSLSTGSIDEDVLALRIVAFPETFNQRGDVRYAGLQFPL